MATSTAILPESRPRAGDPPPLVRMLRTALEGPGGRLSLAGALIGSGLLGLMFWPNLWHFAHTWATDENYSHGFLVPLISLYFANEAARRGPIAYRGGVGPGLVLLGLCLAGRLVSVVIPVGMVGDVAFLLGLAGMVALLAGGEALRRFGFALAFLVFMVPLPIALYATIAAPLQLVVSRLASGVLGAVGIPVLCEGNLITLPGDVRMFVAEACSGMRQLTGFLALTTAVVYLTSQSAWSRAVLVASSIPVAMTANVVRVVITGFIMYGLDPRYASGTFHTIEGLLMMGLGLSLLAGECWVLGQIDALLRGPEADAPRPSYDDPPGATVATA